MVAITTRINTSGLGTKLFFSFFNVGQIITLGGCEQGAAAWTVSSGERIVRHFPVLRLQSEQTLPTLMPERETHTQTSLIHGREVTCLISCLSHKEQTRASGIQRCSISNRHAPATRAPPTKLLGKARAGSTPETDQTRVTRWSNLLPGFQRS